MKHLESYSARNSYLGEGCFIIIDPNYNGSNFGSKTRIDYINKIGIVVDGKMDAYTDNIRYIYRVDYDDLDSINVPEEEIIYYSYNKEDLYIYVEAGKFNL